LLIAAASCVFLLPTLRPAPIIAQQPQPASDRAAQAGAAFALATRRAGDALPSWRIPLFDAVYDTSLMSHLVRPQNQQKMPLSQDQAKALTSLNHVLQSAGDDMGFALDDRIARDHLDPDKEIARFRERFFQAESHAERMVIVGLLTEQQAKLVTRVEDQSQPFQALYKQELQERLGLAAYQKLELDKLQQKASLLGPDSQDQEPSAINKK
jgi:hypothetical protein